MVRILLERTVCSIGRDVRQKNVLSAPIGWAEGPSSGGLPSFLRLVWHS